MPDDPDNQPVELLPCPLEECGGRVELEYHCGVHYVECDECGNQGTLCWTEAEAITAWNTRAAPPADVGLADEMERQADKLSRNTIGGNPMIRDVIRTLRDGRDALRHTDNPRTDVVDATIAELTKDRDYYAERYADRCGQLIVRDATIAEAVEIIAVLSETAADFTEVDQATHERARSFLARQQSLGVGGGEE